MKNKGKKAAAVLALAAGTTAAIHILNRYIDQQSDLGLLEPEKTSNWNWRLGPVAYRKYGTGSPVLLLHELSACSSSYEWSKTAEALAKNHTVYVPDLPGCGLSEKSNITYTNFYFVEMITEFIKNVVQEPCDIIATGLSASLAITSCGFDSTLIRKLILVNPASPYQLGQLPGRRSRFRKGLLSVPIFGTFLYNVLISRRMLEREFSERLFHNPVKADPEAVDLYYESGHKQKERGRFLLSSITGNYVYFNITHALKSIDNDIVIVGGESQEYIQDTIDAYKKMNPAIESVIMKNTKHLPHLEDPEEFLNLISVYIDEQE